MRFISREVVTQLLSLVSKAEANSTGNRVTDDMINASTVAGTMFNSIGRAAHLNTILHIGVEN
jgi:hypothetical protein